MWKIGPARHKSLEQIFLVRLPSPVSRLREGVLRGPRISENSTDKYRSLIAVSIDGSIKIIDDATSMLKLQWMREYLSSRSGVPRLTLPSSFPQPSPREFSLTSFVFRRSFKNVRCCCKCRLSCLASRSNASGD